MGDFCKKERKCSEVSILKKGEFSRDRKVLVFKKLSLM